MLRGIKKREDFFFPPADMLDISKQSSAAVFPQAHTCFTGFSMCPCGTALVINAPFRKSNPRLNNFFGFLELFVSFHVITFFLKREDFSFSSPALLQLMLINACSYLPPLPCPPGIFFLIPPERRHFWNFRDSNQHVCLFDGYFTMSHSFFPPHAFYNSRNFLATQRLYPNPPL